MTEDEILLLHKRALNHAKRFHTKENAEDVAIEVVLQKLEGKGLKQGLRYAAIDANKKLNGNSDSESWYTRNPLLLDLCDDHKNDDWGQRVRSPPDANPAPDDLLIHFEDVVQYRDALEGIHKCVFVLLAVFGFSNQEIALCLGCTDSNVSHILARIRRSLLRKFPRSP